MTIEEFADIINVDIIIFRYSGQDNRYCAQFENTETKENKHDCCLTGEFGNGKTPIEAMNNYANNIAGKWLIVNAMSKDRQVFKAPQTFNELT